MSIRTTLFTCRFIILRFIATTCCSCRREECVGVRHRNRRPQHRRAFFMASPRVICASMRSRACSVSVYRARFAGNLALNSHRAAISRHSAGVATLLRATLTYVITRICDHCGAHRRCLFSAYRRQHVRLIKLPSSPPQLYFVRVVRTSSLLQKFLDTRIEGIQACIPIVRRMRMQYGF